jgi:hypothetical protein
VKRLGGVRGRRFPGLHGRHLIPDLMVVPGPDPDASARHLQKTSNFGVNVSQTPQV